MRVEVGEICESCMYYSNRSRTCDFSLINHSSRLYTNGKRVEDGYCDKYVGGKRCYDAHVWKNTGVTPKNKVTKDEFKRMLRSSIDSRGKNMKNELFDLIGEYKDLYEMLTDEEVDEQTVKDTLEGVEGEIEIKAQGIVSLYDRLDMEIKACEQHMKAWGNRLAVRKNAKERIKRLMIDGITAMGKDELKAGDVTIKVSNVGGVLPIIYEDGVTVPERFTKMTIETDGKLVREALDKGETLDFAHFGQRGKTVRIR